MTDSYDRRFPKVTDRALDDLRKRINVKIENTLEPWCHEATRDNIRHYAHGIGDDNPLWCDLKYAKESRHGDIVALPSFLFSCSRIISGYVGGLPGVHAMWAGADWTWHKWVRRNDEITTEAWLKDLIEHDTQFSAAPCNRFIMSTSTIRTATCCQKQIAGVSGRIATLRARKVPNTTPLKAKSKRYTPEELSEIYALYRDEEIRGATPRYWGRRIGRRGTSDDGEGSDDRHRIHLLCTRVGRPLHSRE